MEAPGAPSGSALAATPASADSATPAPSESARPGPTPTPVKRLTAAETKGSESTPWVLTARSDDSIAISFVAGGGCSAWQGIRFEETRASVEIWTVVRTDHAAQACTASLGYGSATIHLQHSLGTRQLLHAPVSKAWKSYEGQF